MFRNIIFFLLLAGIATASTVTITGQAGLTVQLDGATLGTLPLEPLNIQSGNHTLSVAQHGFEPFIRNFSAGSKNDIITINIVLTKIIRKEAILYSLTFAGLGQRYQNKPVLGWTLTAIEAGGLLMGLLSEMEMKNNNKDYLVAKSSYDLAVNEEDIAYWRAETESIYQSISDTEALRNSSLAIATGAVLVSLLDVIFRAPSFDAKIVHNSEPTVQAGLTFNF
jgi:hypothetical protein